jgi:hypothetical protein
MSPEAITPATMSVVLMAFLRRGVIRCPKRIDSHVRTPVAPAAAVMAPAMHCTHMRGAYLGARPPFALARRTARTNTCFERPVSPAFAVKRYSPGVRSVMRPL